MNIVIIGSGNAAAVLGRKFHAAGHKIIQIYSRQASAASTLAYEWDTESTNYLSMLSKDADVYIVAVSDNAIKELAAEIRLPGKVVAHTAASVPADVLQAITENYGVFYPLQSLRKEDPSLPEIPIYIDAVNTKTHAVLQQLAVSISSSVPVMANDADRAKLHLAAVFVNNFVNHLFAITQVYCEKNNIDFKQLLPLMEETVQRIKGMPATKAQTGPALRHDTNTMEAHLALLNDEPEMKRLYQVLSDSIGKLNA